MFEQSILVSPRGSARGASFALSLGSQMLFLGTALILPLFFIEGPSVTRLNELLVAPPPPPPPPPSIKLVAVPNVIRRMIDGSRLFAPVRIPTEVAKIVETDLPPVDTMPDVGVQGGSIGGRPDGIINSIANQAARQAPPPPVAEKPVAKDPPPAPKEITRVRTGGDVQAAKLVKRIIPLYPPLAKQARISGTVKLIGIIARDGRIINLQVLSGHPLLVPAAVDAVRQWVYQPTLLNDQPVEVVAPIDVNFTLN